MKVSLRACSYCMCCDQGWIKVKRVGYPELHTTGWGDRVIPVCEPKVVQNDWVRLDTRHHLHIISKNEVGWSLFPPVHNVVFTKWARDPWTKTRMRRVNSVFETPDSSTLQTRSCSCRTTSSQKWSVILETTQKVFYNDDRHKIIIDNGNYGKQAVQ